MFKKVIAKFEEATGATVKHSCSQSSEQQIVIDIKAGSPTNISTFPQPGLAANMAAINGLVPLGDKARDFVKQNFAAGDSWADLGTYANKDGKKEFYGVFYNVNLKSLVWYVPENFKENGYKVPKTMEELMDLTKKIAADGHKPWCIGLGSDAATGWPATDWVEDMMLRTQTPDVYDGWVNNTVKFNDPRVIEAIDTYGWFAKNDAYVDGGSKAVATVSFKDSPKGMFASPPKCFMHRQASFIPAFFPDGKQGEADFFYFPAFAGKKLGNPVLGGGTILTITKDSKGARAFMDYIMHPQASEIWMGEGGFLTPLKTVDLNKYKTPMLRKQGEILLNASTFRFDGSDLMPGAVGAGSFWKGMVNYSGGQTAKQVTDEIQRSWDALK
jgi:alpha-glucoside transport system substrate-binding protein